MNIKSVFRKYVLPLSIISIIGGGIFYGLYKYNIVTIPNILMQGLVVNITPEYKIKNIDILVNLKFHVSQQQLKKPESVFKFFNEKNEQIFEVKVKQNKDNTQVYHYELSKNYLKNPRNNDSFLQMFCNSWTNRCGVTFAFSKHEALFSLPEDISKVTLDNEEITFTEKLYDYQQKTINQEIAKTITGLKYSYNDQNIKVCTNFDSIEYTEALRITTKHNESVLQKVCTKEDTNGMCCELKGDTTKFESISVLHWKGSWNEGKFAEYSIQLK